MYESEIILKASDKNAMIRYDEMHTNVIPKVKLSFLLGFIICHKNGIANNKMGYAAIPSCLLITVNQYAETVIK